MIVQVTVDVLKAVVPEEDEVASPDLLKSLHAQVDDIVKVPSKNLMTKCTYLLPDGTCRGLMSAFLK